MWSQLLRGRGKVSTPRRHIRLECEMLEDRSVPSVSCGCGSGGATLPRIVNGSPTSGFASVGLVGDRFEFFCSGTLIAPRYALTAAHCAEGLSNTQGRFRVGGQTYSTSRIFVHPNYRPNQLGTNSANDIAIFELSVAVTGVTPSPINRVAPQVGQILTLVGFGAGGTGNGGHNGDFGTKRVGTTPIDNVTTTLIKWRFDNNQESNTAPGDSGGPAFLQRNGVYYVAGVTSGGTKANASIGDQSYDTRVDAYAAWIDNIVGNSTPNPPPPPPPPPSGGDPGNTPATAKAITISSGGTVLRGTINPGSDADFYRFVAPATGRLVIRAHAVGNLDPMLGLYNAAGKRRRFNDDANRFTFNSVVRFDVVQGRTYFAAVSSYRTSRGQYDLIFKAIVARSARRGDLARFIQPGRPDGESWHTAVKLPKRSLHPPIFIPKAESSPRQVLVAQAAERDPVDGIFSGEWLEL